MLLPYCWRPFAALFLAAGIAWSSCAPAEPVETRGGLLDQPARTSARANRSVLLSVTAADKRLVAVGELGIVLLSDDSGSTWRQAKAPTSVALTNVRFVSASQGWAVGHSGVVLKSSDGGETWIKQLDGRQAAQLELDAARREGGQGGGPAAKRLRDAERLVADGPDKPLLDVHFMDENNGVVVGAYGMIFATYDGGKTWLSLRQRLDDPKGRHLYSVNAVGDVLYIAGEQGALYRSTDGGRTFSEVKTPYVGTYFGVLPIPGEEILVFGLRGNAYRSIEHRANWQKINLGLPVQLTAGSRLPDGSLILVDETGRVLLSRDDGISFNALPVPQPSPFTGVVQAVDGSLVLSGARGMTRLTPESHLAEQRQ